jgi:hypothetical protein
MNTWSRLSMEGFVVSNLPRPEPGEILLTHDIGLADFEHFAMKGIRYSTDGDPSDAVAVYKAIGRIEPHVEDFACATAHISATFQARHITAAYGRGSGITLIVYFASVREKLLIFNGDVGRLGKALKSGVIDQLCLRALISSQGIGETAVELARLAENNRPGCQTTPRLYGNSFEARVFGGIRPDDVSQICVTMNPISRDVQEACERIWKLKQAAMRAMSPSSDDA